ncbi:MAG: hypothetical protein IAA31_04350 [Candidatus Anaerobiospirillum merdipullorum]|uniref:Co-chaperone DjlA N-terminal domain-containing protein n=1 Tax=Candidatus Anaerobiospirillum merdipullorum TaxID=2838450 RepID=A0A9E2KMD0_9GAMM|nr:hypothetical protein [Candidatus Anaerobiospirillum merdipullorum]
MFLPQLARAERVAFINLAQLLIKADDKITSQEETFINYYIYEAKLEASDIDPQAQLDAQLAKLQASSTTVKKIVLVELMALALTDNEYADEEQQFMQKIGTGLGLDDDVIAAALEKTKEFHQAYLELNAFAHQP